MNHIYSYTIVYKFFLIKPLGDLNFFSEIILSCFYYTMFL